MKKLWILVTIVFIALIILIKSVHKDAQPALPIQTKDEETASVKPDVSIQDFVDSAHLQVISHLPYKEKYAHPYLQFINDHEGWMAIGRTLWHTNDEGKNWEQIYDAGSDSNGMSNTIFEFQFINSQVGWVLLFNTMYKTEDGGKTWSLLPQPITFGGSPFSGLVGAFHFLKDGKRGWIGSGRYRKLKKGEMTANRFMDDGRSLFAAVLTTEDGGKSWKRQAVSRAAGGISNLHFIDDEHAWATGQAGAFYFKSGVWKITESDGFDNQGNYFVKSLEIQIGAPTFCPAAVYFLNPRLGWLSNTNGYLAKSTDGGRTWVDLINLKQVWVARPEIQCFYELYFYDSMNGWGLDSDGKLHRTQNGGKTWRRMDSLIELDDMFFLKAQQGWAVSRKYIFRIIP